MKLLGHEKMLSETFGQKYNFRAYIMNVSNLSMELCYKKEEICAYFLLVWTQDIHMSR